MLRRAVQGAPGEASEVGVVVPQVLHHPVHRNQVERLEGAVIHISQLDHLHALADVVPYRYGNVTYALRDTECVRCHLEPHRLMLLGEPGVGRPVPRHVD